MITASRATDLPQTPATIADEQIGLNGVIAVALTRTPERFGERELTAARAAGLTEDEIWDVGAITAFFAMSNRLAHLCALTPNAEFYTMGR